MIATTRRSVLAGAAATAAVGPARAQYTQLTVMVFQGMQNLPLFAAQHTGPFGRRGLEVEIKNAPTSDELRNGLAEGRYQIVHGGVDNAVAMAEVAKVDIAVISGGDDGFNRLYVQPDIGSYADLRGKTVIVDAPNTAYALQLYEMLAQNGLKKGDYEVKAVGATVKRFEAIKADRSLSASMLNPPYSIMAEQAGLKSLGSAVNAIGPYQATAGFVLRRWAKQNEELLVKYLQAYIEGVRWILDPANKVDVIRLLRNRLFLEKEIAEQTYEVAVSPTEGIVKDAAISLDGFRNVLRLRVAHLGAWGGTPPAPEKYIDGSYYQKALAGL